MDVGVPICVHTGSEHRVHRDVRPRKKPSMVAFGFPPLHAFRDLVLNQIPDMFPRLRFGFVEASASWIPFSSTNPDATTPNAGSRPGNRRLIYLQIAVSLSPAKPTKT